MRLTLIFLIIVAAITFTTSATAQTQPTISVSGLTAAVTVRRDARSIPYIEARSDADAYFIQGYVTASDRLWQMDLLRRVARGETAEIFGKSALEEDKRWRRLGFAGITEKSLEYLSPGLIEALDNYAAGVNAYIATLDEKTLPIEFRMLQYKPRRWEKTDSLIIGKILADALSSTWRNDLIRASLQSLPREKFHDLTNIVTPYDVVLFGKDSRVGHVMAKRAATETDSIALLRMAEIETGVRRSSLERIGFYAEDLAASNNWVISGKRTADGRPMLANDPHLLSTAPGIWYLTHLTTPTMRVSGVALPGVPGIVLGHNESIAWGATNVGPDVQDIYFETTDAAGRYKTANGWEPASVRKEEIKVRKNALKTETDTITIEVLETRNGVIFMEDAGRKVSLKWTARDPRNHDFEAFFLINRAKNWDDFREALRKYGGPTQNFVYIDVKGNIGWYAAGRIPIRKTGQGEVPYDASTTDGDWMGSIPFEELPHLFNPSDGLILTANQRIVGTEYKYQQISRDAAPPWRARRIYDLLRSKNGITMDDAAKIQHDTFNIPLTNLVKEIIALGAASPDTLKEFRSWDGRMTAESKAALLANEIRLCVANRMAEDTKPAPAFLIRERIVDRAVRERLARWLPKAFPDYNSLLRSCDAGARASLADTKRFGPDELNWRWGNYFVSSFQHPLVQGKDPFGLWKQFEVRFTNVDGSGQTPNVGPYVSMRHIASAGNWDQTRHVIPLGQSGDPKSPHFTDQFEAWRTGTPSIFPFSAKAVQDMAVAVQKFGPASR